MSNGLPKAKVAAGKTVDINVTTYLLGKRMESVGMLRPGQALMLAATLPKTTKPQRGAKRGKGK